MYIVKGSMKKEPIQERPFWKVMNMIGNIFIINVFWLIGCIPIVTIGASTTAMNYVFIKIIRKENGTLFQAFKESFKQNFKQSTLIWMIYLFLLIDFVLIIYRLYTVSGLAEIISNPIVMGFSLFFLVVYVFTLLYIFVVLALFKSTIVQCFINAFALSFKYILTTLICIITIVIILVCIYVCPVLFFFGFGLMAYLNCILFNRIFNKHIKIEKT